MDGHPPHEPVPGGLQDQVARRLAGMLLWWWIDSKWEYNSAALAREEAGFEVMEEYIWIR